jgi:group I intron endonuclease
MVGIYKITNPTGRIYIGKSIDINKRHIQYKNGHTKSQPKLHNSLKKYGWLNHKVEVIEECKENSLDKREEYWINYYDSVKNGLNLTYGGDGGRKSEITKKRISNSHRGMKKPWAGFNKLSQHHIKKLQKSRINVMNIIYQYNLKGEFIREYQNPKQASIHLGINNGYLHTILDDLDKTLGGFRFTRTKYENLPPIKKWNGNRKIVIEMDLQGNYIKEWGSAKEAALSLGIKTQNITACCRGEVKTCNKSIWKYA